MIKTSIMMVPNLGESIGITGRRYLFKELLQARPHLGRVWLATSGPEKFILKDIPKDVFAGFNDIIRPQLRDSPLIRLPFDTIKDQRIFVYKYLTDDLLNLVRKGVSMIAKKKILKTTLRGIAELHDHDVVHLDIKPDNIMADTHRAGGETVVERVQVTDLENAAYLPKGRCIKGMLPGNDNWRSPEGHLKGDLNKPSDMFSFGAVCVYTMLGRVIFGPDEDFKKHVAQGALPAIIRLQRQVSYFGDKDGLNGLMKHVGDEEVNCEVLGMLWEDRAADYHPYKPFAEWAEVDDEEFRDVVLRMMNLDPTRRITARQALDHEWFSGSDID
ncbi:kinase domain-containing protein [Byssothecium circinans]|uniref:Kinase domain-containing protein n=1 Tax=Byssothecium circinans TaxID=147558 RepID=A0A6A5TTP7_9PLEO|nr:kinase domain-containing protein [Byssothecium circinans]